MEKSQCPSFFAGYCISNINRNTTQSPSTGEKTTVVFTHIHVEFLANLLVQNPIMMPKEAVKSFQDNFQCDHLITQKQITAKFSALKRKQKSSKID